MSKLKKPETENFKLKETMNENTTTMPIHWISTPTFTNPPEDGTPTQSIPKVKYVALVPK